MQKNATRRKDEITLINILFCIMVVFIHVSSEPVVKLNPESLWYYAVKIPWRLAAYVVQGFIFLSGMKLFLGAWQEKTDYKKYYFRRFKIVVLPYILWTVIYYIYFYLRGYFPFNIADLAKYLFTAELSAHFYFVPVIVQFYILLPLFKLLIKKVHPAINILLSLIITIFSAQYIPVIIGNVTGKEFFNSHMLFSSYMIYFVLGCYAGVFYNKFKNTLLAKKFYIIIAFVLISAAEAYFNIFATVPQDKILMVENLHIVYCITAIAFSYMLMLRVAPQVNTKNVLIRNADGASYNIYLMHSLLIAELNEKMNLFGITRISSRYILRIVIVYIVAFGICMLYNSFKTTIKRKNML